jgi:hypothetical protein
MRRREYLEAAAVEAPAAPAAEHLPMHTVAGWNAVALAAIRAAGLEAAPAARLLAGMHTCMYNAWAAYDGDARQTAHGVGIRLPRGERDAASQAAAMHHAAWVLLGARLPAQRPLFDAHLAACGSAPDAGAPPFSPAGIGRAQALSMLDAAAAPFAALPGGIAAAPGQPDGVTLARCWAQARRVSAGGRHGGGRDVLLYMVLAHALADAGGTGASAAAEVLRRFGAARRDGGLPGREEALGREIGGRVFEKGRRYWLGKL